MGLRLAEVSSPALPQTADFLHEGSVCVLLTQSSRTPSAQGCLESSWASADGPERNCQAGEELSGEDTKDVAVSLGSGIKCLGIDGS